MRKVSDKTLIRDAKRFVRDRHCPVRIAVELTFRQHHVHNPPRFGQICRAVENGERGQEAVGGNAPTHHWYQEGCMA